MKKRLFSGLLVLLMLLAPLAALPATAAPTDYAALSYTLAPLEEGGKEESGSISDGLFIKRTPTVTCDNSATLLSVNGTPFEEGSAVLSLAGLYELTATSRQDPTQSVTYEVTVLPEISITADAVYTHYPTVTCENAVELVLDSGNSEYERTITSGEVIRSLGRHNLQVIGRSPDGSRMKFPRFFFYIMACSATRVTDESGKQGITVTVGEFDDLELDITLDGEPLEEGSRTVTKVGAHTLSVLANGQPLGGYQCPSKEDMFLRVALKIDALDTRTPLSLPLSQWDGEFYLDGKRVEGDLRVTRHGDHELVVRDADGEIVEGAFLLTVGEEAPVVADVLAFRFVNLHLFLAIGLGAAALLLAAVAVVFLLKRRSIV